MTAPTPRDTGPALDPRAVEAAADALYRGGLDRDAAMSLARLAVTAAAPFLRAEGAANVVVSRCPQCDAGEPCQVVRDSYAIALPETGDGAEDAPCPMRDEPAPSPDDPHGACSRNLVAVAVERDKARAKAAAASERHEDDLRRLLDCREVVRSLTAERDEARAEAARLRESYGAALDAVLALHQPDRRMSVDRRCVGCSNDVSFTVYPCPTVAAITDALGADR